MKVKGENVFVALIVLAIVLIVGWLVYDDWSKTKRCNGLQGVVIREVCYEAASLKIIPVQ